MCDKINLEKYLFLNRHFAIRDWKIHYDYSLFFSNNSTNKFTVPIRSVRFIRSWFKEINFSAFIVFSFVFLLIKRKTRIILFNNF